MSDLEHVTEIDRVLRGQETGRDTLVADSWRRCIETYGMDPTRPDPAHIVPASQLREHREQAERLVATARSGLRALFRQVAGQNYVLLLADAKGVCVDFFGDPRFEDDLRQAGLTLGSDWSEDLAGTCGVGSCIVTGEAVTIHQGDHFGLAHTPLSCTSAPIYDTCGQLTAVLDISLLRSPSPKSSQNLAMNLVRASARRIEMANLMAMTRSDWVLRFSTSPEFLEVDPEAAVALDGSGRIVGLTHGAQACLSPESSDSLIGQRIDSLLHLGVDDLPDLMRGRPTEDRVLHLRDGRGLFGHAIAPQTVRRPMRSAPPQTPECFAGLAGQDPAMQGLLQKAARLAAGKMPVLLLGETGTGKETLARAIHVAGGPPRGFHALRCAGLRPETVAALEEAKAGTLFLKGVEDLDEAAQGALLKLLDRREDLRVIASARDRQVTVPGATGLREDLHFRAVGAVLDLPPLRLRSDVDWLIERLLRRRTAGELQLSPAARAELAGRDWPGNIRELQSTLDTAVSLCDGRVVDLPDLPARITSATPEDDLEAILDACGWNMARAARRLGVNRSTVLRRVRKSGLTPPA
ncbi:sigma-54-dependent Fis family transcriptional regulator [Mameliella sp. AT18]|uniref:sigma-54-dependent Fis family transcriptional regulator n=1 Tax=Mameliella sp. AT18 TaxID=3028385 RepID=UPI0008410574|nr:sigma-54-dependent Fis family transcriptional regulator [Mameliella sp. AT18]MDD9729605.1 sigma-54-dependent Fis family transcriptional regulator [Mameliella sp. AT18]ODM48119.1 transcriptional regulator [Ruegeria sp. PBVC088]